jgi:hypothetical protein
MVLATSLTDALTAFDHELKRVSHLAATRLGAGLPHDETATVLRRLGIGAPNDVLEWFAWHNGSNSSDEPLWRSVPIGPTRTLLFRECVRLWADAIAGGRWTCDETDGEYPDWTVYPDRGSVSADVTITGLLS